MNSILLVEDGKFLRFSTERTLTKAGYHVVTAGDGEEALRLARQTIPDLILLDMMLPKMSGPEVLRALKKDPNTTDIPIIVLSSLPQANATKLRADGATCYFEKSKLELDEGSKLLLEVVRGTLAGKP